MSERESVSKGIFQKKGISSPRNYKQVENNIRSIYSPRSSAKSPNSTFSLSECYQQINQTEEKEKYQELKEIQQEHYYIDKLRQQRQKIEFLREQFQKKDQACNQKDLQIVRLKKDSESNHSYKQKFEGLSTEFEKMQFEFRRLKAEKQSYQNQLKKIELQNYREVVLNLREDLARAQSQIETLNISNDQLTKTAQNYKSSLYENQSNFNEQIHQVKLKWQKLGGQINTLKKENERLSEQSSLCQNKLLIRQDQLNNYSQQISRLKKLESQLRFEIDKKDDYIQNLRNQYERKVNSFQKQISDRDMELDSNHNIIQKQYNSISELKMREKQNQSKINQLNDHIQILNDKLHNTVLQYKKTQALLDSQDRIIKALKLEINDLQERLKCMNERKLNQKKIKYDLDNLRSQMKQLRRLQVEKIDNVVESFPIKRQKRTGRNF